MEKNELITEIIRMEWKAFDQVKNQGGRAECQDDWNTFQLMRKSQYLAWPKSLLESFYADFVRADEQGWNLITEKYGRMMEYTVPEEYEALKGQLPDCSEKKRAIVNQIAEIQVAWMEQFAERYPNLALNARSIHSSEDSIYNTSYETYLKGELLTYSDQTLALYGHWIVELERDNENLAKIIMTNTAILYGYDSLEAAEEALNRDL